MFVCPSSHWDLLTSTSTARWDTWECPGNGKLTFFLRWDTLNIHIHTCIHIFLHVETWLGETTSRSSMCFSFTSFLFFYFFNFFFFFFHIFISSLQTRNVLTQISMYIKRMYKEFIYLYTVYNKRHFTDVKNYKRFVYSISICAGNCWMYFNIFRRMNINFFLFYPPTWEIIYCWMEKKKQKDIYKW